MDSLFTISTEHGGLYYSIFYMIAFVIAFPILIYEGYHRKYPLLPWILIISSSIIFLIIGTKLLTYSGEDWKYFLNNWQLPHTSNKTILGGILFGIIGILTAKWWFRFKQPVMDAFAFVLPLCMAIQRVGCLMRGCCFGKPTDLPWAIKYSFGSMPYHVHLNSGLIDPISNTSLAIHPTQLYQIIYCLAIVFIIWRIRKFWKAPGNLFFSSVILYGVFRFLSEFFRDPAADGNLGGIFGGLKYVQWGILIFILVFSAYIIYRERSWRLKLKIPESTSNILYKNLIFITFLTSLIWLGRNWFTVLELTVLYIIIFPGILGVCWQIYKALTIPFLRWLPLALVAGCIILMGQTLKNNETDDSKSSFHTLSFGGMFGKYEYESGEIVGYYYPESCAEEVVEPERYEPEYKYYTYEQKYKVGGLSYSYNHIDGKYRKGRFGLRLYAGNNECFIQNFDAKISDQIILGINPYYHYDWRWVGLGGGFHLGTLPSVNNKWTIFPQFDLRFGPCDIVFSEISVADHFPGSFPAPLIKIGIGTGLGLTNGTALRFGTTHSAGNYISASIPVKNKLVIEPFYGFGSTNYFSGEVGSQFSLKLNYRFNFKSDDKK